MKQKPYLIANEFVRSDYFTLVYKDKMKLSAAIYNFCKERNYDIQKFYDPIKEAYEGEL